MQGENAPGAARGSGGPEVGTQSAAPPSAGRHTVTRRPVPDAGPWPFVDRGGELEAVLEVVGGADPAATVVSGPPGAGRTRLAREVSRELAARGRRVEWVTCTRAISTIPLGALAHLGPVDGARGDLAGAWQALAANLDVGRGNGRPAVVVVDDAHLLNDLCAALVFKLVLTRTAAVLLTVSDDAPGPDLVETLWKDGLAVRLDLGPLTRRHVEGILEAALGGLVESRTSEQLWRTSGGSAVFLREVVSTSREAGHLTGVDGLWRWDGIVELTQRLRALVRTRLGELTAAEREALELLTLGVPLELSDLVALTSAEVVASLERRGLVVVAHGSRRPLLTVAQPLHAQVLHAQLPHATASDLRRRLVATASVQRWVREDPLRVSQLLLRPDTLPAGPAVLTRAATQANGRSDHHLAEQLARSALQHAPHVAACVALAESLRWQGRHSEAEQVAGQAALLAGPGRERESLDTTRALNLFHGLGRVEDALGLSGSAPGGDVPGAVGVLLRVMAGHPHDHDDLDEERLSRGTDDPRVRLWVAVARTTGLAMLGHIPEALGSAAEGWRALAACGPETESSAASAALASGELMALELSGQLERHQAKMHELHEMAMARSASAMDGIAALGLGSGLLAAGRPVEAVRWLVEAAATLVRSDPIGSLRLCRARQAQAHALLGDPTRARAALAGARAPSAVHVFDPELLLAESWLAASEHREDDAAEAAIEAASLAARLGQRPVEARALHTAARLGRADEMTGRLRQLSDELGDRLLHAFALQADAAASGSGERLDDVAAEFARIGAQALAADARAQAAEAHRDAGHRRQASASAASAVSLARSGGGIHTPALDGLVPYELTGRERQVATLAAEGVSNHEIARRLVLSVRTVETHLARVYDKLGINGRGALRGALTAES